MEIWLSWQNESERFQLPLNPPKFTVKTSINTTKVDINAVGMINLIGKSNLRELQISSIFPGHKYSFLDVANPWPPKDYIHALEKWRLSGFPIRVVFTGEPAFNCAMVIENFEWGVEDGTDDFKYTLDLKEYVFLQKTSVQGNNPSSNAQTVQNSSRTTQSSTPKTYVIKKGDTLSSIARKLLGDANRWREIYNYGNNKKIIGNNPNLIHPNKTITIPNK